MCEVSVSVSVAQQVSVDSVGCRLAEDKGPNCDHEHSVNHQRMPTDGSGIPLRHLGLNQTQTWEDKDEAGCKATDERDDTPDVGDGQSEDEGETEPDECVQETASALPHHVGVHICPFKT